jgi:hypothetical protein
MTSKKKRESVVGTWFGWLSTLVRFALSRFTFHGPSQYGSPIVSAFIVPIVSDLIDVYGYT